jgi:hypothetical protein
MNACKVSLSSPTTGNICKTTTYTLQVLPSDTCMSLHLADRYMDCRLLIDRLIPTGVHFPHTPSAVLTFLCLRKDRSSVKMRKHRLLQVSSIMMISVMGFGELLFVLVHLGIYIFFYCPPNGHTTFFSFRLTLLCSG